MRTSPFRLALIGFAAFAIAGCGASEAAQVEFVRVFPVGPALEISDFKAAGIKTVRQYDVTDLPSATAAWYGFRRAGDGLEPLDYEIRFYPDHVTAIADGEFYADDVSGENANILSTNSAWGDGGSDRQTWFGGTDEIFVMLPKYNDYVIYGNTVILCQGPSTESSQEACMWLVDRLEKDSE
jgi:hypothetical protein